MVQNQSRKDAESGLKYKAYIMQTRSIDMDKSEMGVYKLCCPTIDSSSKNKNYELMTHNNYETNLLLKA